MDDVDTTPALEVRDATIGYGEKPVLRKLNLSIPQAKMTILLGPNGCGKSTLLRALGGLLPVAEGKVLLGGRPMSGFSRKEIARSVGLLAQTQAVPEGLTAIELVRQGRYPHRSLFGRWTAEDQAACDEAMALTTSTELIDHRVDKLSGGQRQRVWIAMTLAQRARVLLLDEPTTYLDLAHQIEVLSMMRSLVRNNGVTIVAVLHDINQAARYADRLVFLKNGEIDSEGAVADVLSSATIRRVFETRVDIISDPVSAAPIMVPRE